MITGSLDKSVILWDQEKGKKLFSLKTHKAEIICVSFNSEGDKALTGPLDYTAKFFDTNNGEQIFDLNEHKGEISACQFKFGYQQFN